MDRQQIDIIDLNIGENYLNDWDVYYAIREIIANALDEQQNENIEITYKNEEDECIIRDFGSGLKIENFIMMGSSKISNGNVIGKFGVGLKDALGVLNNNGIQVKIRTAKYLFKFYMKEKSKITNAQTLHVYVYPNNDKAFKGTEFIFKKCKREYIEQAKKEFLIFKWNEVEFIEKTQFGDILKKENNNADIYINGMKIGEDKNLAFSYNIKNISSKLKKSLNRERKYISRDAYREDIKRIIKNSTKTEILDIFEKQLRRTYSDNSYAEIKWNTVLIKISKYIINKYKSKNVRFICNEDIVDNKELYDLLCKSKDVEIINVSEKIKKDINKYRRYIDEDNLFIEDSFVIEEELLNKKDLNESQRNVLEEAIKILNKINLLKNDYLPLDNIRISKVPIGNMMHEDYGIIIPLNSLMDIETCAVKIINVTSSLGNNSAEFKERIVGNLIKIIYEQNINRNNN
ncbi:ATP-binding protein [Clostridium sporogenes]|uniref:ATP-binding protein n=1 Tax=Clostridium sporogenes TaxID=1509 RepID=A0AAE4FGC5_CLOSG|nr:ATP-binding protein [Clostridium sporogenes]MDS1002023.1 ATP-binding protein [Clostridium sporogenes]